MPSLTSNGVIPCITASRRRRLRHCGFFPAAVSGPFVRLFERDLRRLELFSSLVSPPPCFPRAPEASPLLLGQDCRLHPFSAGRDSRSMTLSEMLLLVCRAELVCATRASPLTAWGGQRVQLGRRDSATEGVEIHQDMVLPRYVLPSGVRRRWCSFAEQRLYGTVITAKV